MRSEFRAADFLANILSCPFPRQGRWEEGRLYLTCSLSLSISPNLESSSFILPIPFPSFALINITRNIYACHLIRGANIGAPAALFFSKTTSRCCPDLPIA